MTTTELIRTVRFRATHHYRVAGWSREKNREAFGSAAEPHGHEYALEVTVAGEPDSRTGFVVDLSALDRALEDVLGPLRGTSLNEAVSPFREGRKLPSTENLSVWFWEELRRRIPGEARLVRVRVFEDDSLGASCRGSD